MIILFRYEMKKLFQNKAIYPAVLLLMTAILIYMYVEGLFDNSVSRNIVEAWKSIIKVIDRFFFAFFMVVILFTSPVFAGEHESGISETLSTTYLGKHNNFMTCKLKAALVCVNASVITLLAIILALYYIHTGLSGAETDIQSIETYSYSLLRINIFQFVVLKLIAGILGSNIICLLTMFISLYNKESFTCFMAVLTLVYIVDRSIILSAIDLNIVDFIMAFFPVNSYRLTIIDIVPDIAYVYVIGIWYIAEICISLYAIRKSFSSGCLYN